MPFPPPTFMLAHGVLGLDEPMPRRPDVDEAFMAAIADEFPTVASRQLLPAEAPQNLPHLLVQSTSSQVAFSSVQADFEVRFYGDYSSSPERCHEYIERKMSALLRGWEALGVHPALAGVVLTLNFSLLEDPIAPVAHLLETHLKTEATPDRVHNARVQLGLRVADRYFATLALSNYESRTINRPLLPGAQTVVVRPWEGSVDDIGLELTIDVNNRLRAIEQREHMVVDIEELQRILHLLRHIADERAQAFAELGTVDLAALAEVVA